MACLLSGAIIAGVFLVTEPVAQCERANMKTQALKELVKDAQALSLSMEKQTGMPLKRMAKQLPMLLPENQKGMAEL